MTDWLLDQSEGRQSCRPCSPWHRRCWPLFEPQCPGPSYCWQLLTEPKLLKHATRPAWNNSLNQNYSCMQCDLLETTHKTTKTIHACNLTNWELLTKPKLFMHETWPVGNYSQIQKTAHACNVSRGLLEMTQNIKTVHACNVTYRKLLTKPNCNVTYRKLLTKPNCNVTYRKLLTKPNCNVTYRKLLTKPNCNVAWWQLSTK